MTEELEIEERVEYLEACFDRLNLFCGLLVFACLVATILMILQSKVE